MKVVDHDPAKYKMGDIVNVSIRYPIGHYRVPMYMRGKQVEIVRVLGRYINPEEEAFGKNAGGKLWFYLISIRQKDLWSDYLGDELEALVTRDAMIGVKMLHL